MCEAVAYCVFILFNFLSQNKSGMMIPPYKEEYDIKTDGKVIHLSLLWVGNCSHFKL